MNRDVRIAVGGAAAIVTSLAALLALNYVGYCMPEGRFLSRKELIDVGLRDYFPSYPPPYYTGLHPQVQKPVAYASLDDFVARNPDCCSLTSTARKGMTPTLLHRLLGHFASFVKIEYKLEEGVPDAPDKNVVWIAVTNCGHPWNGIKL
jgi:hypothetical protein